MTGARQVEIIHTAQINGKPVRFVRSPLHGIDVPWVIVSDVLWMLGVDDLGVPQLSGSMHGVAPVKAVLAGGGIVQIAPPWTLVLMCEMIAPSLRPHKGALEAFKAAYPDLSPATRATALLQAPSAFPPGDDE